MGLPCIISSEQYITNLNCGSRSNPNYNYVIKHSMVSI